MAIAHFNKKAAKITAREWRARFKSDTYRIIKSYCNDDIMVSAEWHGRANSSLPRESRKIFIMVVHNNFKGSWLKDVSLTQMFATIDEMMIAYEAILLRHTESELVEKDDDLVMVERGNLIESEESAEVEAEEAYATKVEEKVGVIGGWS
ncbi:MAG: hypothetical protein ABJG42_24350 [Vibrio splendidus]